MATVNINYGTRTEFPNDGNLNGSATGTARVIGAVDNSTTKADSYKIDATIRLATTGVTSTGTLVFYLIESTDGGTTYTDNITNVTTSSDQLSFIKNARVVYSPVANSNNQVVNVVFDLPNNNCPKAFSLVVLNSSGATISTTSNTVYYTPITFTVA